MKKLLRSLACLMAAAVTLPAQAPTTVPFRKQTPPVPAAPVDPITAIIEAFRSHAIVALGNVEFRGNEQSHAFQLSLVRDPRFTAVANDIVVEFGNARYQEVLDRFVRGEDITDESLRPVWQNTTQVEYEWDLPIYEDLFRAVREVNRSLPQTRQLRILLGDPPIDWNHVHSLPDLRKAMGDRDGYAVDLLRREVLAKGRRALVIFGGQHLIRRNVVRDTADEWAHGIVARLEKDHIANVFTILPETRRDLRALQPEVGSWPIPSLAFLRGTTLGSAIWDSSPQRRPVRMEDQFDTILYLGPPSSMTMSKLSPALCANRAYMEMRLGRLGLVPAPPGANFSPADQLRDYCSHPRGHAQISDREPDVTELVRKTLQDAAQGNVNPNAIAPESRERLIRFLQRDGPRHLGPAGALESLVLLVDTDSGGKRVRSYRAVFASGLRMIWTVGLSPEGSIVSLDSGPE